MDKKPPIDIKRAFLKADFLFLNIKPNAMKNLLTTILLLTSLIACEQSGNDPAPFDSLESIGILGRWEITDEVINGVITDLLPKCCEFLEFLPDDNLGDYTGILSSTDSQGLKNTGTFVVNTTNQTILFIDDDQDEFMFKFSVNASQDYLTIEFTENGNVYTQGWVKVD
jgi:hypothetical protein